MSLKRQRERRESSANSTQEASARVCLTFKAKESAFSFPELIQLCSSFSPLLGCVDKELVLFSFSDKEPRPYLGTTSTSSSSVNRFCFYSRPNSAQTVQKTHLDRCDSSACLKGDKTVTQIPPEEERWILCQSVIRSYYRGRCCCAK